MRQINGLKMVTASYMLRKVKRKTPERCYSTKFAELSNPLTPSIAADTPKNRALGQLTS
jgi:hypothetical protein